MRAHQVMTKNVITVTPTTPILDAANLILRRHFSGLPVLDETGALVGIITQSDFLHRSEIGTQRKRSHWLQFLIGPRGLAADFVQERGRKVEDVMTRNPVTVQEDTTLDELVDLMEMHGVHRLPVMRDKVLVGIVSRSNLLRAFASAAREIPDPTADDDHIRDRIIRTINGMSWGPGSLQVVVRNGVAHLYGVVVEDEARQASIVAAENTAGVKEVHDHMYFFDTFTGAREESPEDLKTAGHPDKSL
jgi:CBS-domain-containing membrane protein